MSVRVKVRCVACGHRVEVAPYDFPGGDVPMCPRCFSPMVAESAVAGRRAPSEPIDDPPSDDFRVSGHWAMGKRYGR